MKNPKIFNFLQNISYSSFYLWCVLILLKIFNLKPEINISLFIFLSLLLFSIIYFKEYLKLFKGFFLFLKHLLIYSFFCLLGIFGILLDIFVLKFTSDLLILILLGFWILSVCYFKIKGRVSLGSALGFLILCPFLLIFSKEAIAEKAAVWAYLFLVVGVIQLFIEYFKEGKENVQKKD